MPRPAKRSSQWTPEGLSLVGQVVRFAREVVRGESLEKFVWDAEEIWGYEVLTRSSVHAIEAVRSPGQLNLGVMAFAQPLTWWPDKLRAFTTRELLDVAAGKLVPELPILPISVADAIGRWLCLYPATESEQLDLAKIAKLPDLSRWRNLRDGYAQPTQNECKALSGLLWLPGSHRYTATDLWVLSQRQSWAGNADDRPPYLAGPIAATEGAIYRVDDSLTGTT